ncbi:MAG: YfhO family protein [Bacteroidota bacterium]
MKKYLPHVLSVLFFMTVTFFVFQPLFQGKELKQTDIDNWKGMSKELTDFKEKTGEQTLWTNSMFGGMPAYQISAVYPANLFQYIDKALTLGLPSPANMVFLFMIGFYLLLITMRIEPLLAVLGAVAFAFSSYFFIVIEAGHNSKAHAIGYMAPVVAGVLMTYRGRLLTGSILTGVFLALELYANHLQISYYLAIIILLLGVSELYRAVREKQLPYFLKASALMLVAVLLAVGSNITNLMATQEYAKYSTRGPSELTSDKENKTGGLDRDYITDWSYGVGESFTLLVPGFKGGASEPISKNHRDALKSVDSQFREGVSNFGAYFGDQPFTNGPVYVGCIIVLLFVIGLFIVEGPVKWWLAAATLLSLLLSWGRNFMGFTNFFLDNVPGYDKFRAVAMILVIAEFTMPLLAVMALHRLVTEQDAFAKYGRRTLYAGGAVLVITLLIALMPDMFTSFYSQTEYDQVAASVKDQNLPPGTLESFFQAISQARRAIVVQDAWRTFAFLLASFGFIYAFLRFRFQKSILLAGLVLLVVADLGTVNARYLSAEDFERVKANDDPFPMTAADQALLQDTSSYRVLNLSVNTFNDASTSYRHQSIGGYHGAKMKRYQELIASRISEEIVAIRMALQRQDSTVMPIVTGQPVLNMLNAKYFILNSNGMPFPNYGALGNAWFVPEAKVVENADAELEGLKAFDPTAAMLVDRRYSDQLTGYVFRPDSTATIRLDRYQPNHLTYSYATSAERLTVFSEVYYDKGWNAYVDGKPAPYFRTDYVLRGMRLPAGKHTVEFRFEPEVFAKGEKIALASSGLLVLLLLATAFIEWRKSRSAS